MLAWSMSYIYCYSHIQQYLFISSLRLCLHKKRFFILKKLQIRSDSFAPCNVISKSSKSHENAWDRAFHVDPNISKNFQILENWKTHFFILGHFCSKIHENTFNRMILGSESKWDIKNPPKKKNWKKSRKLRKSFFSKKSYDQLLIFVWTSIFFHFFSIFD